MIYTLGHKESYDAALAIRRAEGRPLLKAGRGLVKGQPYEGGSVWRTREEAEAHIRRRAEEGEPLDGFAVYGIDADWKKDTILSRQTDATWRCLKRDAAVIPLEESHV